MTPLQTEELLLTCFAALIFYYASVLAAHEFTVNSVMTVISMLLFSMGYAAQVLSWSLSPSSLEILCQNSN